MDSDANAIAQHSRPRGIGKSASSSASLIRIPRVAAAGGWCGVVQSWQSRKAEATRDISWAFQPDHADWAIFRFW
ncbi:hypothetical protein [Mycolicibacterium helvum]|uniref:Uncharacterized protein n=1 Tax=Mycolicibacterium helvum TaxID=1534349 RepID=A0A7I7TAG4_9MYCO|nr:hypothetical protein [Mycolicibacterium helvum]BBY66068.1 hypothetical protein MHEL_43110 [Mycolicibacterium helvum]